MSRRWVALTADVVCVLLFVVIGRRSHDEGDGIASVLGIAAPFVIGLAVGWLLSPYVHRSPRSVRAGIDVWVATVVIGMFLRRLAWERSTALSFVIVTAAFLALTMLGWRLVVAATSRPRREVRSGRPPLEAER